MVHHSSRALARAIATARRALQAEEQCSHSAPCPKCSHTGSKSYPYHYGATSVAMEGLILAAETFRDDVEGSR